MNPIAMKVTATPAFPPISDRLTVRGPLSYTARPGSPFLALEVGDELFNLTVHSENATVPTKTYSHVRVRSKIAASGKVDIDFEEIP